MRPSQSLRKKFLPRAITHFASLRSSGLLPFQHPRSYWERLNGIRLTTKLGELEKASGVVSCSILTGRGIPPSYPKLQNRHQSQSASWATIFHHGNRICRSLPSCTVIGCVPERFGCRWQVVDTLLKMRAGGFADAVAPLVQSDKAWIRRLAKKYVGRYPSVG